MDTPIYIPTIFFIDIVELDGLSFTHRQHIVESLYALFPLH